MLRLSAIAVLTVVGLALVSVVGSTAATIALLRTSSHAEVLSSSTVAAATSRASKKQRPSNPVSVVAETTGGAVSGL